LDYSKKSVLAIIVTYNRLKLLKECINAISKSTCPTDILVVNNNSSDGTKEFLLSLPSAYTDIKFYIYNLDENLNGAGGFNYGLKNALKLDYDFFWIMDDDCIVRNDSLAELINAHHKFNGQYGFLSSKVLWTDGSICKTNVQRKSVARKINDFNSPYVNVDYASFVSLFVKKNDVEKVGLPIKDFIIWTDDLEWTRRLTLKSIGSTALPGYLCNKSIVTHKCKNNFGVTIVKDTSDRIERYKYIYRNDVYCFRREGIRGLLYLFIRNVYHIIKVLLLSKDNKLKKIKVIINGYISGFNFNPIVEYR